MGFKSNEAISDNEKTKIKQFIDQGLKVLLEIDDLKGGLRDTAKAIAEELEIKPAILMKALRPAHKASMEAEKEAVGTVEDILVVAGRL